MIAILSSTHVPVGGTRRGRQLQSLALDGPISADP